MNGRFRYKAFISYSHSADAAFAPVLQAALHRFAKPWYRLRSIRTFRDQSSLDASPDLWRRIEAALDDSEYLLFLASPDAARSQWTEKELLCWFTTRDQHNLIVLLTEGTLEWDHDAGDFDWERTDSIPPVLRSRFSAEPLYVDFRGLTRERLSTRDPGFLDRVATIAATLHGKKKDEIHGEDIRQHRRTKRIAVTAVAALVLLLVAAVLAGLMARQRGARVRQTLAQSDFLQANDYSEKGEHGLALAHLARAVRTWPSNRMAGSRLLFLLTAFDWYVELRESVQAQAEFVPVPKDPVAPTWREDHPVFRTAEDVLYGDPGFIGRSPDGSRVLYCGGHGGEFGDSGTLALATPWGIHRVHQLDDFCRDAAFEPRRGDYFVTLAENIQLWETVAGERVNDLGDLARPTILDPVRRAGSVAFERETGRLRVTTPTRQTFWEPIRARPIVYRSHSAMLNALIARLRIFDSTSQERRSVRPRDPTLGELDTLVGGIQGYDHHPTAPLALVAGGAGAVLVWNIENGQILFDPLWFNRGQVRAFFLGDGNMFMTEDTDTGAGAGVVRVWDTASGKPLSQPLTRPRAEQAVSALGVTADGTRLVIRYGEAAEYYSVHDIPYAASAVPGWLADLAESLGGFELNELSTMTRVRPEDRVAVIERIRADSAGWTRQSLWEVFGRWLLEDPDTRSLSPLSSHTLEQPAVGSTGVDWTDRAIRVARNQHTMTGLHATRLGHHQEFERLVFEFEGWLSSYQVGYASEAQRACYVDSAPGASVLLRISLPQTSSRLSAPGVSTGPVEALRQAPSECDKGPGMTWLLALSRPADYRVTELADPPRLVIDIQH